MKNLNTKADGLDRHYNPIMTSELEDISRFPGEVRMLELAATIPERANVDLPTTIQSLIAATINATQAYLCQVVTAMSLTDPLAAQEMVVCTSGLDALSWLDRTEQSQGGWIPNYPVTGHITMGALKYAPNFGMSLFEPGVSVMVNRKDEQPDSPKVIVSLSVSTADEMISLAKFLKACDENWVRLERAFKVEAFTSIPLPDHVELTEDHTAADYAHAFVEYVVKAKGRDEDSCLETLDLEFDTTTGIPLHQVIHAACSLLHAFHLYDLASRAKKRDLINMALDKIRSLSIHGSALAFAREHARVKSPYQAYEF